MTETTSTNTTAGVVAHGLHALADHIATHQLAGLTQVDIEDDHLELHLDSLHASQWWTVLRIAGTVDDVTVDRAHRVTLEWVTLRGRLPDSGVRVVLQWARHRSTKSLGVPA